MRGLFLLFSFLISFLSIKAQHKPGYVVLQNNDTIYGIVNAKVDDSGINNIYYKSSLNGLVESIPIKLLKSFKVGDEYFVIKKVKLKYRALRTVVEGKVSLYKLYYKNTDFNRIEENRTMVLFHYVIDTKGKLERVPSELWFKNYSKKIFSNYPVLVRAIESEDLRLPQTEQIVLTCNAVESGKIKFPEFDELEWVKWRVFFLENNFIEQLESRLIFNEKNPKWAKTDYVVNLKNDTIYGRFKNYESKTFIDRSGNKMEITTKYFSSYRIRGDEFHSVTIYDSFSGTGSVCFMKLLIQDSIKLYEYTKFVSSGMMVGAGGNMMYGYSGNVTDYYIKNNKQVIHIERKYRGFYNQCLTIFKDNLSLLSSIKVKEYGPADIEEIVKLQNEFLANQVKETIENTFEQE